MSEKANIKKYVKIACLVVGILFLVGAFFQVINTIYSFIAGIIELGNAMLPLSFVNVFVSLIWMVVLLAGGLIGIFIFLRRGTPGKTNRYLSLGFMTICVLLLVLFFLSETWTIFVRIVTNAFWIEYDTFIPPDMKHTYDYGTFLITSVLSTFVTLICCSGYCVVYLIISIINMLLEKPQGQYMGNEAKRIEEENKELPPDPNEVNTNDLEEPLIKENENIIIENENDVKNEEEILEVK